MLERLIDFVCGYEDVAFESDFDLDASIRRLSAEVKQPLGDFRPLISGGISAVVGKVSEHRVSLWCETLMFRNGFGPTFIGYFQSVNKRVLLVGKLGITWHFFIFFILVFGMAVVVTLAALSELMTNPSNPTLWVVAPLIIPVTVLFTVGVARISKWLFSGSERWLLAAIQSSLRSQGGPGPLPSNSEQQRR
jgi:hypothetical protein